jgi:hypothetical protein
LSTVLQTLLASYHATWAMRDGVLWITAQEKADEILTTAVFDVRDLCRDEGESDALIDAIQNQTEGPWQDLDGIGGTMDVPKTGVLVVRQTEPLLQSVLELLQNYRTALLASKPRPRNVVDPKEVITQYYRMEAATADDLERILPLLVQPESWRSERTPDAPGFVLKAASKSELRDVHGRPVVAKADTANDADPRALVVQQAVLIIRQTRAVQDEIAGIIRKVESGDATDGSFGAGGGIGGGGFGGGGFGGGFFSPQASGK